MSKSTCSHFFSNGSSCKRLCGDNIYCWQHKDTKLVDDSTNWIERINSEYDYGFQEHDVTGFSSWKKFYEYLRFSKNTNLEIEGKSIEIVKEPMDDKQWKSILLFEYGDRLENNKNPNFDTWKEFYEYVDWIMNGRAKIHKCDIDETNLKFTTIDPSSIKRGDLLFNNNNKRFIPSRYDLLFNNKSKFTSSDCDTVVSGILTLHYSSKIKSDNKYNFEYFVVTNVKNFQKNKTIDIVPLNKLFNDISVIKEFPINYWSNCYNLNDYLKSSMYDDDDDDTDESYVDTVMVSIDPAMLPNKISFKKYVTKDLIVSDRITFFYCSFFYKNIKYCILCYEADYDLLSENIKTQNLFYIPITYDNIDAFDVADFDWFAEKGYYPGQMLLYASPY